jgi:uncharacterized membrane protein YkvA (DUF1232 family)
VFFRLLLRRIRGIIPMIKDKKVAWWKKAILIFGMVYLFLPADLIPPIVPVFGWFDDLAVWVAILYFMRTELDSHIPAAAAPGGKYDVSNSDVHEAEYTVTEEEDQDEQNG